MSSSVKEKLPHGLQPVVRLVGDRVNLAAVARRQHDDLVEPGVVVEIREALLDGRFRDGKLFAHLDGRRLMIQPQTNELHG